MIVGDFKFIMTMHFGALYKSITPNKGYKIGLKEYEEKQIPASH